MKTIYYKIFLSGIAAALSLAACTDDDGVIDKGDSKAVYPEIHIGVSEMSVTPVSRAIFPMLSDDEKYVKTMAIFEFDNEGLHVKSSRTYHFIDFIKGTVDNVYGVGDVDSTDYGIMETTLRGIAFEPYSNGMVCAVANISEDDVEAFYQSELLDQSYGLMTLDEFQSWALPFEYVERVPDKYDESTIGHLKKVYMFGYYEGEISSATPEAIDIDFGRLAARLDITIVNETGATIDKRLGYHFDNVCRSAYFFPMKKGVPPEVGAGVSRTVICTGAGTPLPEGQVITPVPETFADGAEHTRYFYVAAHSAANFDQATKLHLFYDTKIVGDEVLTGDESNVKIPLCNVHPSDAAGVPNGYSLSRNTRYHFTVRLKKAQSPASQQSRSVEYGDAPGEITVYLP